MAPSAGWSDLAQMLVQPDLLMNLNPFLSPASRTRMIQGVSVWLQVRFDRLASFIEQQ